MQAARFQFSLATALCFIAAVAILCAMRVLVGGFSFWVLPPGAFLAAACWAARRRDSSELAWGLIAIAWLFASTRVVECLIGSLGYLGGPPSASQLRRDFITSYVYNFALPLFLSLPAAYLATKGSLATRSYARKWIILCPIVAVVNITVLTAWLVIIAQHVAAALP